MGIREHLTRKSLDLSVSVEHPTEILCVSSGQKVETYKPILEDFMTNGQEQQQQQQHQQVDDEHIPNRISSSSSSTEHVDNAAFVKKGDEVTFIKWDVKQESHTAVENDHNGQAKGEKMNAATISKEELLLYANDPFWVRLRWICFVFFWAIWVALLFMAILIMLKSPKCITPSSLMWYQRGIFVDARKFLQDVDNNMAMEDEIKFSEKIRASGVIYELSPHQTYDINRAEVVENIKMVFSTYKKRNVRVIVDLIPNLLPPVQDSSRHAWAIGQTVTETEEFSHAQYGNERFDLLLMSSAEVRRALAGVVRRLIELGVHGIRFKNTDSYNFLRLEQQNDAERKTLRNRELHNFLKEFHQLVRNSSTTGEPIYFASTQNATISNDTLFKVLKNASSLFHKPWNLTAIQFANKQFSASSLLLFTAVLPGVSIVPNSQDFNEIPYYIYKAVNTIHESSSYMHGDLVVYDMPHLLAYSRERIGNPGYFVVSNPTNNQQRINVLPDSLPVKMTLHTASDNAALTARKLKIDEIEIPSNVVIILTYVPLKHT